MVDKKEYALWGTKDGIENIISINKREVQNSLKDAKRAKAIIEGRGIFDSVRIQIIDFNTDINFKKGVQKLKN